MKKLFLLLLLASSVAYAETYEWIDSEGTVHFSGSLPEIPAAYRKSAIALGMNSDPVANSSKGAVPAATGQDTAGGSAIAPGLEQLKERIQNDEGTMELVRTLMNDPQMQALLNDPALLRAAQSGDITVLLNNPGFMKLLSNPKVQEIEKRVQRGN